MPDRTLQRGNRSDGAAAASGLDPGPFLAWFDGLVDSRAGTRWGRLAAAWAISNDACTKRIWRWRNEATLVPADQVTDALGAFDTFLWDLYEEQPELLPSGRRPPSHKGFPITIPEDVLLEAHRRHLDEGLSLRAMGREYFDRCGSKSPEALSRCLHNAFKQRGWETLSHADAITMFNRRKVAHLPRCSHVHQLGDKKGTRCTRRTARAGGTCWHHEPNRIVDSTAMLQARAA